MSSGGPGWPKDFDPYGAGGSGWEQSRSNLAPHEEAAIWRSIEDHARAQITPSAFGIASQTGIDANRVQEFLNEQARQEPQPSTSHQLSDQTPTNQQYIMPQHVGPFSQWPPEQEVQQNLLTLDEGQHEPYAPAILESASHPGTWNPQLVMNQPLSTHVPSQEISNRGFPDPSNFDQRPSHNTIRARSGRGDHRTQPYPTLSEQPAPQMSADLPPSVHTSSQPIAGPTQARTSRLREGERATSANGTNYTGKDGLSGAGISDDQKRVLLPEATTGFPLPSRGPLSQDTREGMRWLLKNVPTLPNGSQALGKKDKNYLSVYKSRNERELERQNAEPTFEQRSKAGKARAEKLTQDQRSEIARAGGKAGGHKGGKARAEVLTRERRSEIGRLGGSATAAARTPGERHDAASIAGQARLYRMTAEQRQNVAILGSLVKATNALDQKIDALLRGFELQTQEAHLNALAAAIEPYSQLSSTQLLSTLQSIHTFAWQRMEEGHTLEAVAEHLGLPPRLLEYLSQLGKPSGL